MDGRHASFWKTAQTWKSVSVVTPKMASFSSVLYSLMKPRLCFSVFWIYSFRDPTSIKRAVTSISWHPDGPERVAVAHCVMQFQRHNKYTSLDCYVYRTGASVHLGEYESGECSVVHQDLQPVSYSNRLGKKFSYISHFLERSSIISSILNVSHPWTASSRTAGFRRQHSGCRKWVQTPADCPKYKWLS